MGGSPTKLFHAIVGLGLAAAGCGDVAPGTTEATEHDAGNDGRTRPEPDAVAIRADATVDGASKVDAFSLPDTSSPDDVFDVQSVVDAAMAHDAAVDVAQAPPPPEIK